MLAEGSIQTGVNVKVRILWLAAALAVMPALAEEVPFNGRMLELGAGDEARPILRMSGTQYAIQRSGEQLVEMAGSCLARQGGVVVESADPAQGLLLASVETGFRASFSAQTLRSRLRFEAGDGRFQIVESDFSLAQGGDEGSVVYGPLVQSGSVWEKGLEALVETENRLVDCLYR